jgi:hypothetical protein
MGGILGSGGVLGATGGNAGLGGKIATGGATGGVRGTALGGAGGNATSGTGGSAGSGGRAATSGAIGGSGGKATGGAGGNATSGTGGKATGGAGGNTTSGMGGKATGGTGGNGGSGGKATGGAGGNGGSGGKATGGAGMGGSAATGTAGGTGGKSTGGAAGSMAGGSSGTCNAMDAGTVTSAGNPNGSCSTGVPARGQAVDVSNPTTVVGTGSEASCTFSQLQAAATKGGIITFNCGSCPVTIAVTATLNLPTTKNTVIDGGNKITLDGQNAVQILRFDSANFRANDMGLTLQHITIINGKTTPTLAIPVAPAPCSQGWNDGEGGALYMRDGTLTVIDSIFINNQGAALGPDTGGGAIYVLGSKNGVLIVGSTFSHNAASNAGAVGCLFAELDVYNSLFTNNTAIGNGANNDDATQCSAINNGQHEIGSGGNGGALYSDGNSVNITLCGDAILNNSAGQGAFGGGLFFTSNDMGGTLSIADTTMTGNTGGHWTVVASGSVTNVGSAVGTNAKSITVSNSTLQDYP